MTTSTLRTPILNFCLEPGLQLPLRPLARGGGRPAGAQSQGRGDEKAHCSQAGSQDFIKKNLKHFLRPFPFGFIGPEAVQKTVKVSGFKN